MSSDEISIDHHFVQLVLSLQAGAMQQMGKVANPLTGTVERDLPIAQETIDILGMLEAKTKGNLTQQEQRILTHVLYELRMNFVDETKREQTKSESSPAQTDPTGGDDAGKPKREDGSSGGPA